MKHKNILLIVFCFTLLVFQPVQASTAMPTSNSPSQINLAPANEGILYDTLYVYVYQLIPANDPDHPGAIKSPATQCEWPRDNGVYGCGTEFPGAYREPGSGFFHIDSDYYLRNVLPNEMDFAEIAPDEKAEALKAQAIASRTVASYKAANSPQEVVGIFHIINNSTQFQVFIPGTYNSYPNYQGAIETALEATPKQFIQYITSIDGHLVHAADAEFSSDIIGQSGDGLQNYLKPVQEPISSSTCNLQGAVGNGWGMSQRGAIRWAKGNTCPDETGEAWSVKWDYKQILAHYYTGIEFKNDDASDSSFAPDDRWNLLKHTMPLDSERMAHADAGSTITFTIQLQNTSKGDSTGNSTDPTAGNWTDSTTIGYRWSDKGVAATGDWILFDNKLVPPVDKGMPTSVEDLPITIPAEYSGKDKTLHLDLYRNGHWLSSADWPDATIDIHVNGTTATPTVTPTATSTVCTHWNLAEDFRTAPNQENPNRDSCGNSGVWEFLASNSLVRDANYYKLANFTSSAAGVVGVNDWIGNYSDSNGSFPDILYNASGAPAYWWPVNTIDIHPGPNQMGIIAWHSPLNGYVSITGGVSDNNPGCGDGIVWYLDRKPVISNYVDLASGSYGNGGSQTFATGSGGAQLGSIAVNVGDIIYLAIHPNGNYLCDDTTVNFQIDVGSAPVTNTPTPLNGPTPTDFPPNYTPPPPTETPSPTATPPTPVPTTNFDCHCPAWCLLSIMLSRTESNINQVASLNPMPYIQQTAFDIQVLYRVRDEVLSQTPEGQHYVGLYYGHGAEISELITTNVELRNEAVATLQLWEPNLRALVDGQGSTVTITSGQVQAIQTFLDHLYAAGSIELRQTIATERALNPLEETIGTTMDQASVSLVDYQVPITPTYTPTWTATPTETPTPTPTPIFTPTSTHTHTPTPTSIYTPTKTPTPTRTPTSIPTATPAGFVFANGFESGNFSAWSSAGTDGGDLSVTTQSAAVGTYGMQAFFDDGHELIVYDNTPNNEKHYSARFYFDPNSAQITSKEGLYLFSASSDTGWGVACVYLEQQGDHYSLSLCGKDDSSAYFENHAILIADEWQAVEIEWQAASAPGANDGTIKMWIGNQLIDSIEHIDNDTQFVTSVGLGTSPASTFTASGAMYFDAFESRTGAHIGLDPNGPAVSPAPTRPDLLFADDFESGDLSHWNPTFSTVDGGDLSASAVAAHQSNFGLQALIDDTINIKLVDDSPANETHYHARYYFNPNSLVMSSGSAHYIFDGVDASTNSNLFRLELVYESGAYKLRPRVMKDNYDYQTGSKYAISNAWHVVEVEWQAASAAGANDGFYSLWIDDTLMGTISGVDNDTHRLDQARLGVTAGVDATTSGSMLFDDFESRRNTYIGPIPVPATTTPTPSATATQTETPTPTQTETSSPTLTPTLTPQGSITETPTYTPTGTPSTPMGGRAPWLTPAFRSEAPEKARAETGVDIRSAKFWQGRFNIFDKLVNVLEKL